MLTYPEGDLRGIWGSELHCGKGCSSVGPGSPVSPVQPPVRQPTSLPIPGQLRNKTSVPGLSVAWQQSLCPAFMRPCGPFQALQIKMHLSLGSSLPMLLCAARSGNKACATGEEEAPSPAPPLRESPQDTSGGHHQFLGKGAHPVHKQLGFCLCV